MAYSTDYGFHEDTYLPDLDIDCDFQRSSGSYNYANVAKLTPNDSTYNYCEGWGPGYPGTWDFFRFTDDVPDNATNIGVKICIRCKSEWPGSEPGAGWCFDIYPKAFQYGEQFSNVGEDWEDREFSSSDCIDGYFYYTSNLKNRRLTPSDIHNMIIMYTDKAEDNSIKFYVSQFLVKVRYDVLPSASFMLL